MPPKNKNNNNNKNKKSNNNNKQPPQAEPASKQGKHNDPGLYAYRNTFISEITNELQSLSHKLKKSINEKKSEQQQEQEDEDKNIDEHQQKLEERFKQVEQLLHVPDPEPFLVCCVVNSIHNLRVMVDPKKKSRNDNDGSSSSSSDDESNENEFPYDNNTRLWDYSLWDCPPKVLRSGKLQLYKFQQRQLEKQARFEKYRKDGENLAITTAIAKARKRQERLLFSEQHHHLSSKEKKSKKSKKEKKNKRSKKDKKNDDEEEVEEENDDQIHQQPFSGDFVTVSSWTSIPAPPIISATTRHEKVIIDENEVDEEDDDKKKQEKQYPPPKKIPISPMPSCYLSTYDKNVNPIVSKVAKETNNDKEEMDLVFHATTQAASAGAAATLAENNNNKVNKKKHEENNHHRPNFHSSFVDAPPSRVIYDPSRYSKVVAQTDFEIPHPALPQLAATFNTKMEISCLLTAPTMYHDMPSSAESMAMSEYEQKYYSMIPSTQEWMEKVIPTADLPVFPTAAALRIFGKGAQKGLREFLERYRSEYAKMKMTNRDDGSEESKKMNRDDDDDDDDDEASTINNSNSKNSEHQQQPTHCHAPYSTSLTTTKRRIKFPYYAALLKLYFKGTDAQNDDDDEDQDENNQEYIASSSEAKSSSNGIFISTSNENSKNDNNDDNNVLYHDIHLPQKLLSNETSFTLVHTLGPVQFLPPVESALLVPRAPTSMSLVICEVPDPELSCAEKILVRYILDILESDEFYGSVPHTQLYNLIRDTPQFDVVIGAGGADGQCCYETFIDFVDAHVNVEFAGFSYTQEEIDELLLKRLNEEMMQEQINNSKQDITSTSNKPTEKKSDLEKQFASFGIPQELRLVAWKNVNHFIEGDYARWASKFENERKVCDVLASFLSVRPYEQLELLKLVGQDRAFVSLAVPCVKRMLDQVSENPRYVVLNSRLHPLTVELREDLVDIMKRNYYFSSSSSSSITSNNTRGRNRSGFHNEDLSSGADEDETEEERQERRRRDAEISERDPQGVLTVRQQRLFDRIFTQEW